MEETDNEPAFYKLKVVTDLGPLRTLLYLELNILKRKMLHTVALSVENIMPSHFNTLML